MQNSLHINYLIWRTMESAWQKPCSLGEIMTTMDPSKNPIEPRIAPLPGFTCPAIIRCCEEWTREHHAARALGIREYRAIVLGNQAYKNAMPALNNRNNIRDFIACVTYGILIRAILDAVGVRLLYAAQVASTACKRAPRKPQTTHSKSNFRKTPQTPSPSPLIWPLASR
jgi:hypothetical protein